MTAGPLLLVALKGVLAGGFVVLLSSLTGTFKPRFFAGLFAAAPSVAVVSLVLAGISKPEAAALGARGMVLGAIAMTVCCATACAVKSSQSVRERPHWAPCDDPASCFSASSMPSFASSSRSCLCALPPKLASAQRF